MAFAFCLAIVIQVIFQIEGLPDGCGAPGIPVSGRIKDSQISYPSGSSITYVCEPSHQLFGNIHRECNLNGQWTGDVPICGRRVPMRNVLQSSIFSLGHGLATDAIDQNFSTCSQTKLNNKNFWSGDIDTRVSISGVRIATPRTQAQKNALNVSVKIGHRPDNTYVVCLKTESVALDIEGFSNVVQYLFLCPQNTVGNTIFLQQIGTSPVSLRLCEIELFTIQNLSCRIPDYPLNSYKLVKHGATTSYVFSCHPGYELRGDKEVYCSSNGTWHPKVPVCAAITCGDPPPISNGHYYNWTKSRSSGYSYNDSISYQCDLGYNLAGGPSIRRCVGIDQWSGLNLTCERPFEVFNTVTAGQTKTSTRLTGLVCHKLDIGITNGSLVYEDDLVTLECDPNHHPANDTNSTCVRNGGKATWNPPNPEFHCTKSTNSTDDANEAQCPPPTLPGHLKSLEMERFGGKFKSGDEITVQCANYYEGVKVVMTCNINGTWSNHNLLCLDSETKNQKLETPALPNNDSTSILIVAAFLIGASSTMVFIGAVACIVVLKRNYPRSDNTDHRTHSLFHINMTGTQYVRNTNEEEHIYQVPPYEDVMDTLNVTLPSEPEVSKRRAPTSGLPLVPIYAQPFNAINKCLNPSVHIYAEPVRDDTDSNLVSQNIYEHTSRRALVISTESLTSLDSYHRHGTLKMVDNELYVSEESIDDI